MTSRSNQPPPDPNVISHQLLSIWTPEWTPATTARYIESDAQVVKRAGSRGEAQITHRKPACRPAVRPNTEGRV